MGTSENDPKLVWQKVFAAAATKVIPVLAVGVPVLYVIGRVYRDAYWYQLGLPSGVLIFSFEDYVYGGFVAIANGMFSLVSALPFGPLGAWLGSLFILALVLAFLVSLRRWLGAGLLRLAYLLEKKIKSWRAKEDKWHVQFGVPFLILGQWLNGVFLALLLPVLIIALVVSGVLKAGKSQAQRDIDASFGKVSPETSRPTMRFKDGEVEITGLVVQCAIDWCVVTVNGDLYSVHVEQSTRFSRLSNSD